MRAAVVSPGEVVVRDVPEPVPGPYHALVRILYCGICNGTDLKVFRGTNPRLTASYPGILGHESMGRVVSLGSQVRYLREGALVFRPMAAFPGESLGGYASMWGGFAEYGLVLDVRAFLEDTAPVARPAIHPMCLMQQVLPDDYEAFGGPLAWSPIVITIKETLSWLQRVGLKMGQSVAVTGTGPAGLSLMRLAALLGAAPVIAVGRREEGLRRAERFGATVTVNAAVEDVPTALRRATGGGGVDLIADTDGDPGLLASLPAALADMGQMAIYSILPELTLRVHWPRDRRNWCLRLLDPDEAGAHEGALSLLRLGALSLDLYEPEVIPLEEIRSGIERVARREALKVIVDLGDAT